MSYWAKSLSALLPGPHPCVSNKVTFEREQEKESGQMKGGAGSERIGR